MQKIKVTVTNLEPISLRVDRSDETIQSLDYIPGKAFRGALASIYLKEKDEDDPDFKRFFITSDVKYPNLYPISNTLLNSPVLPFPNTAVTCKRWPGIESDSDIEAHGIVDRLFEWAAFSLSEYNNYQMLDERLSCFDGRCNGQKLQGILGYYQIDHVSGQIINPSVRKIISTHSGVNRISKTVAPGILYNIEMIAEGHNFSGELIIENDQIAQKFVVWLKNKEIYIGNKRSSGQGFCKIVKTEVLSPLSDESIKANINDFNREFKKYLRDESINNDGFYFSVTAISDIIRLDSFLNYNVSYDALVDDYEIVYENITSKDVLGWNALHKLPQTTEKALIRGSVAVFKAARQSEELMKKLLNIEKTGVGIRKQEGFGRVVISSPFHWRVR